MPRVSVVIPVYNSAQFLSECVESLLGQNHSDCEFIFVNDGSKDDSREIILAYREKDNRISLINQENHGVSVARNNGIAAAKGDFLAFVDADDTIAPEMLGTLMQLLIKTGSDIVCSGFIYEQDGHTLRLDMPFEKDISFAKDRIAAEVFPFMLRNDSLNSVANKMYRRSLVSDNRIQFPQGQELGEDAIFNFKAMKAADRIVFTGYAGYFYRETAGSATRNLLKKDYFRTALDVYAFDYVNLLPEGFDRSQMQTLKELRLIEQMLANIGVYAKPNREISARKRFSYISNMITHPLIQKLVRKHWAGLTANRPRFAKFVLYCVKHRQTGLLWLAQTYSNFRNKK